MENDKVTLIRSRKSTVEKLKQHMRYGQTYDDKINELLDMEHNLEVENKLKESKR